MYVCSNGVKTAVILQDTNLTSPRDPDYQTNLTKMVCWHRRYNLGDKHDFADAQEFMEHLVKEHLTAKDVFQGICVGLVDGYQLVEVENVLSNGKEYGPSYSLEKYSDARGNEGWHGTDWFLTRDLEVISSGDEELRDLIESFTTRDLYNLLDDSESIAIKTLYLYDHSGLSISTGSFVGRAQHAEWDSGPVGFVYMDKKTAMENMAMPKETMRIGKFFADRERDLLRINLPRDFDPMDTGDFLEKKGFKRVGNASLIRNLDDSRLVADGNEPGFDAADVNAGFIFKKGSYLYRTGEVSGESPYQTINLTAVASFNPDLQPMTAEAWKAAAVRELEADTKEYDNYLTDEVYGYRCFEGLEMTESCCGFNPIHQDIKDLMNDELRGWFGSKMEFEYIPGEDFDIEEYFEEHAFPELRNKVEKDVKDFVIFEEASSKVYPFAMAAKDILNNKDLVLDRIVQEIYDEHAVYDTERIYAAVEDHAGLAREMKPKLRVEDLEPGRDYTAEELLDLIKEKTPLADVIHSCEKLNKSNGAERDFTPERDDR